MGASSRTAAVVGATGYAGAELVSLLDEHPRLELSYLTSRSFTGQSFASVYPRFQNEVELECEALEESRLSDYDVVFLALPHGVSQEIVPEIDLSGTRVVDLGADYRFPGPEQFSETYESTHSDPENLEHAVYGLAEFNAEQIKQASLIANPGCYATAALLPLTRLLRAELVEGPVYIDAKSGLSGAGRSPKPANTFVNCNEEIKPYKVGSHRHSPEIETHLPDSSVSPLFVPHVVPADRGIEAAVYLSRRPGTTASDLEDSLRNFAADCSLIRFREQPAGIKAVARTPYCDLAVTSRAEKVIVFSCLDNLLKGAASQALQNANLMFDYGMTLGLDAGEDL